MKHKIVLTKKALNESEYCDTTYLGDVLLDAGPYPSYVVGYCVGKTTEQTDTRGADSYTVSDFGKSKKVKMTAEMARRRLRGVSPVMLRLLQDIYRANGLELRLP